MNTEQVLLTFFAECPEVLQAMEDELLAVETSEDLPETINAIFRAAHTLKGSAGLFGFTAMIEFTHVVETVLDEARQGQVNLTPELVQLLLACVDQLRAMLGELEGGVTEHSPEVTAQAQALLGQLKPYSPTFSLPAGPPGDEGHPEAEVVTPLGEAAEAADPAEDAAWHVSVRFDRGVLRRGLDPLAILAYLRQTTRILGLATIIDPATLKEDMDPESCFLGFELRLAAEGGREVIEQAFEFFLDDARLLILPPGSPPDEYRKLLDAHPDEPELVAALEQCGSFRREQLLAPEVAAAPTPGGAAEQEPAEGASPEAVEATGGKGPAREARSAEARSIRVDSDKLDTLINLVGELITAASRTDMVGRGVRNVELQECTSSLLALVQRLRDSTMQLRMVKIGATFNRFQRVVHDVSRELGKDISLVVSGEDTELDKTVVEKLSDPLMHLVRNAMDHGIEPAEVRAARGKPAGGTVRLNAFHDSGSIVIEVTDDGGGLRRDKILEKARARGLVPADGTPTDRELFSCIFEPGFSTAEKVTNLSGRGVGMDVVKRNIVALRGSIELASEEGVGTTVSVRLPLTLAMIDGFLVGVGGAVFVIPLDMIEECLEFSGDQSQEYTNVRGQVLPFIRLREAFDIDARPPHRQSVVVVRCSGRRAGLVVDTLMGEFQTVIKPLGRTFKQVRCIGGATILGTGEVALIVDVPMLMDQAQRRSSGGNGHHMSWEAAAS